MDDPEVNRNHQRIMDETRKSLGVLAVFNKV